MPRRDAFILLGIVAVGAVARFVALGHQSFDHDEAVTASRVLGPNLFDTLDAVAGGERSPPLFYVLAWGWSKAFGTGEVGLRSLSALAGTLVVPFAYAAGRSLASRRAAFIVAALAALNPYLVWYSQEARSYSLMTLFVAAGLAFFAATRREPKGRYLALWALASALAIASHYFAIFVVAPQAVWLLVARGSRAYALRAVAATCAAVLVLLPFALAQADADHRDAFTEQSVASRAGETALNFVASEQPRPGSGTTAVDVIQLAAGLTGIAALAGSIFLLMRYGTSRERQGALRLGTVVAAGLGIPLVAALSGIDFFNPRNLIGALPPLLVLVGIGLGVARPRLVGISVATATCAVSAGVLLAVHASDQMQRPDWRGVAAALGTDTEDRLLVVPINGDDPLAHYLDARKLERKDLRAVRVRVVDAVSTNHAVNAPPGFHETRREGHAPVFILWRFAAPTPKRVTAATDAVLSESSRVLLLPSR